MTPNIVTIVIEGYPVHVKVTEINGAYMAEGTMFFSIGCISTERHLAVQNLRNMFLKMREIAFTKLITSYGIEKPKK